MQFNHSNSARIAGIATVLCLGLALTGCQREKSGGATPGKTDEKRELSLWIMPNSTKPQQDMEAVVEKFEALNPGVDVRVSVVDWAGAWTKLTTAAIGGDGPDVVQLGTTWCASMTDMGTLLPLDSLVAATDAKNAFLSSTWDAMKPRASEHPTSLPWFIDVRPVFYRTDVFAKAKVDAKSILTWDDYAKALGKIHAADIKNNGETVSAVGFTGKNDWNVVHNFAPWIWGTGGDFLTPAGDKCALNSPESMQGILFFLGLVRKGYSPKENMEKNTAQVAADFQTGRLATFAGPTNQDVYFNLTPEQGGIANSPVAKNYSVFEPPAGPKRRLHFMGGSHLAVFKTSRQPALAQSLVRFLTTDKAAQLAYAEVSGFLPAYKQALDDPYFTQDERRKVFREIAQHGYVYPSVPYWAEIETAILMKRLGNLLDIAAEVSGPYSEAAVRAEVAATVKDIDGVIAEHFKNHPGQREMMAQAVSTQQATASP